jgi:hypothetical protein
MITSACEESPGVFSVIDQRGSSPIVDLDSKTGDERRSLLPWKSLQSAGDRQIRMSSVGSGKGCLLVQAIGDRFAIRKNGVPTVQGQYVQRSPSGRPDIAGSERRSDDTPETGISASADSSTIAVVYGGSGEDQSRIMDIYDSRSGTYLRSMRFPFRVVSFHRKDSVYYVLHGTPSGFPAVSALVYRPAKH